MPLHAHEPSHASATVSMVAQLDHVCIACSGIGACTYILHLDNSSCVTLHLHADVTDNTHYNLPVSLPLHWCRLSCGLYMSHAGDTCHVHMYACVPMHVLVSVPVLVCMLPIPSGVVKQHVQLCQCMEAEWPSVSIAYVFILWKTNIAHFEASDCLTSLKWCNVCPSSCGHICNGHRCSGH